jgi:hypothetical protein
MLFVDPSDKHGAGPGAYRLTHMNKLVWAGDLPFTLWEACVTDAGEIGGYTFASPFPRTSRWMKVCLRSRRGAPATFTSLKRLKRLDTCTFPRKVNGSHIGRFGWKGNVATLREFTLQACSNELGLEVPGVPRAAPPWQKNYKAPGNDLTIEQCEALVSFIAALPRPVVRRPETPQQSNEIEIGHKLFASIGCSACHREKLGEIEGIYSDLLLHDMGPELSGSGSYAVISLETASKDKSKSPRALDEHRPASEREWRTPPLWGLRDSAPYLHDGQANTIADAVSLHGGEGLASAEAFERLKPEQRKQIEQFLQSLAAPSMSE